MQSSLVQVNFSSDYILREQYKDPWNEVRIGKLLEDLDALAGTISVKVTLFSLSVFCWSLNFCVWIYGFCFKCGNLNWNVIGCGFISYQMCFSLMPLYQCIHRKLAIVRPNCTLNQ